MSSQNDNSAARLEHPHKASPEGQRFATVQENARSLGSREAYDEMSKRSLSRIDDRTQVGVTGRAMSDTDATGLKRGAQTLDGKDQGLLSIDMDGKSKFDPSKRADHMSSQKTTRADGTTTTEQTFDGRRDGLKTQSISEKGNAVRVDRSFDGKRPDGMLKESVASTRGTSDSVTTRTFDGNVNPQHMTSETVTANGKTTQTERSFQGRQDGMLSESINKGPDGERSTQKFQDGTRVETQTDKDGNKKTQVFDKDGKPKENDPRNTDKAKDPKEIEDQLKKFQENLEKDNKLPPLKGGQGPYQALEEAMKHGTIPKMSPRELLQEARRIRDREFSQPGHPKHFKQGEQLQRYSPEEIGKKVEAERQRLKGNPSRPDTEGDREKKGTEKKDPEKKDPEKKDPEKKDPEKKDPEKKDPEKKDPEKKDPEKKDPEKKDPEKKDPEKKDPEKKDPEKKDPEKKDPEKKDPEKKDPENKEPEKKEPEKQGWMDWLLGRDTPEQKQEQARKNLDAAADQSIKDPGDRAKFRENMKQFEERAKREGMNPDEVAKTYDSISKLLGEKTGALSPEQRSTLAQNFMYHAADPTNIDQGSFNTCNETTVQEKLMTQHPSVAADALTQAALKGSYTAPDGKEIKLDAKSMQPMPGGDRTIPLDGERSYATQVLNHVLANDISQRKQPPQFYTQITDGQENGRRLEHGDNGERLKYADGTEVQTDKGKPMRNPGVYPGEMAAQIERLTGEKGGVALQSGWGDNTGGTLTKFDSAKDLADQIQQAQKEGRIPLILYVDGTNPIFKGNFPPDSPHGAHVISIRGYNPSTGEVQISNQWGKASDLSIPLDKLFDATKPRSQTRGLSDDHKDGYKKASYVLEN